MIRRRRGLFFSHPTLEPATTEGNEGLVIASLDNLGFDVPDPLTPGISPRHLSKRPHACPPGGPGLAGRASTRGARGTTFASERGRRSSDAAESSCRTVLISVQGPDDPRRANRGEQPTDSADDDDRCSRTIDRRAGGRSIVAGAEALHRGGAWIGKTTWPHSASGFSVSVAIDLSQQGGGPPRHRSQLHSIGHVRAAATRRRLGPMPSDGRTGSLRSHTALRASGVLLRTGQILWPDGHHKPQVEDTWRAIAAQLWTTTIAAVRLDDRRSPLSSRERPKERRDQTQRCSTEASTAASARTTRFAR